MDDRRRVNYQLRAIRVTYLAEVRRLSAPALQEFRDRALDILDELPEMDEELTRQIDQLRRELGG